jgi:SAM-dependent methyltransferase
LHGVATILRFNWPAYAAALLVALVGAALIPGFGAIAAAVVIVPLYFVAASLLASWIVYDRSEIYAWTWLRSCVGDARTVLNVHAGFDETTAGVQRALQRSVHPLAFYDPAVNTEASIARAQNDTRATRFHAGQLPVRAESCDAILFLFAAHEMRTPAERDRCFADAAAALRDGGRIVLLEHLRDARNFAAFAHGAFHFFPRREWLRVARTAGLHVVHEAAMTPFVRLFVLARDATSGARP